jgi:acyl-[acyl-carrier-protein]-phospholipid O-acyltransferase/long-chain-fatty-acid--[acyl-carrier-protein] ligase
MILPRAFLRNCRKQWRRPKVADSTGVALRGGELLMRTLVLRRLLLRHVVQADETYVGILLPPTAAAVVANAALPLCGRIAVNLNYTLSAGVLNSCLRQCGIRHVLTSRKLVEKTGLALDAEFVYLEDFRKLVRLRDKLVAAVQARALPMAWLDRLLGVERLREQDLLTVVFTSGSTGEPKGVMLTNGNVGSNIAAIDQLVHLRESDVLIGILPFFHSMGYTTTLWTVLTLPPKGVYHVSPLDARRVGELCREHQATILISTPTFLRSYLKRCPAEDMKSLDVVIAGAEKLPSELCDAFEAQFGVRPVEGYGTTELSPLVSVNIPKSRALDPHALVAKEGTVGRPIPGVRARVTDRETGEVLGSGQPGMLWITGPNVMRGYLHQPEMTAQVIRDGWYMTGDIAQIDDDGFIRITDRESRFSKIGGEMVPHLKVEETIRRIVNAGEEELKAVVTAVPDSRKGERLVVAHTALDSGQTPEGICKAMQAGGLPPLWIPSPDSFFEVPEIPVLGSGKLDLKGLKSLATERFSPGSD